MLRRWSGQTSKVGPARKASIKNVLAADAVINNAAEGADADGPIGEHQPLGGRNPLYKDCAADGEEGETKEESALRDLANVVSAESRRKSTTTRKSLTDNELEQVLGHIKPLSSSKEVLFKRRISASSAGAAVLGSSKDLGIKSEKQEEMQKFMDHIKQQPRATYVPMGCAEKILEQAGATAEETKTRHHNVVVTLDATYRAINQRTTRHYADLILRLQQEMRTELRRLAKESKTQEELVENLRDKIASQTAAAAAREQEFAAEREKDQLMREGDVAEFNAVKQNMVDESRRVLSTTQRTAKQASEAALQSRTEDARRRSVQRIELEDKAVRTTVALVLSNVVSAVEEKEHHHSREDLHRGLATAKGEQGLLRTELTQAMSVTQSLRDENAQLIKEGQILREEAITLKAELEDISKKAVPSGSGVEKEDIVQSQQQGAINQGGGDADEAVRARVEREQAEAMAEDESNFMVVLELVRRRREAREAATKVAALTSFLEKEHATVRQLHHDAKALASSRATAPDCAVSETPRVEPEAGELEAVQTVDEQEAAEAVEEKKAMEKAMEDAVAEQKKREEAGQDKKALGVSIQRVAELEAQAISLTEELATAKQQAADARAAAHSTEKQLLAPSVASAPLVAGTTTTPTMASTATASLAAAAAAGVGAAGRGAEESAASSAEAAVVAGGASIATPVGVGVGLKIEKGPSSEALRLEELKAELQATTVAKKKVKAEIKGWLKDFEEREGRPAGNEEKGAIRDKFVEHKKLEKALAKLAEDIQALEAEIEKNGSLATESGGGAMTMPNTPATPAMAGFGGGHAAGIGFGDTSTAAVDTAAATAMLEKLREENTSLTAKLEESERRKAQLKTALGELNHTTVKMLGNVHSSATELEPPSPSSDPLAVVPFQQKEDGQSAQQTISTLEKEGALAAEDTGTRETELEESLRVAQQEARDAALASKKSEHLREQASLALAAARGELKACQLVVDEASEAARLRDQVEALKVDLDAKSRAATAGWDAAANAESEAEAAEVRGLQAGIKRGRAEVERKVRSLKEELSKATALSGAGAAVASATDSARSAAPPSPTPAALDTKTEITVFGASTVGAAAAAVAAADTFSDPKQDIERSGNVEAWVSEAGGGGDGLSPAERKARELENAEKELQNLKEREQDAKGEAERMIDELQRASVRQEKQREREAGLVSAVASLEKEKEALSRGMEMAQERAALAMELVAAHTEEAAKARQESALNAAKFRRASRDAGQASAAPTTGALAKPQRAPGGRPPTASGNRRTAEQLRLAAATLVHAIKEGTELWKRERREECHALYVKAGGRAVSQMPPGQAVDDLRVAIAAAKSLNPAKAAIALRKAFDTVIEAAMVAKGTLEQQRSAARRSGSSSNRNSASSATGGRGRGSRGGTSSPASLSASGSVSPARNAAATTPAGNTAADVAQNAAAIANALVASVSSADEGDENAAKQDGSATKVASLQRQLEALSARQKESAAAAVAAAALSGDGFSDDDDDDDDDDDGDGEGEGKAKGSASLLEVATRRCTEMEDKIDGLEVECKALREALAEQPPAGGSDGTGSEAPQGGSSGASSARARADALRIKSLEQKNKDGIDQVTKLEAQVVKLKAASNAANGKASKAEAQAAEAKAKAVEAKMKKETEKLSAELEAAAKGWESCRNDLTHLKKERDDLRQQVSSMGTMGEEMQVLRTRAEAATRLESELEEATANTSRLEGLFQVEQSLRKKYWNMMEDMKGKIRVFARCRPLAQYELNQDCKRAVRFVDDSTVEVDGHHGAKQFVFDSVFSEEHGQAAIFEDTRNLVQSALDGFNVCVFAYGQTGSGKTWTMTGGKGDQRGLTPRAIEEIYGNIEKAKGALEVKVSCYFIELYLDNLRDLLFAMDHPTGTPPRLEIHMDSNKMVVVKNVVVKEARNASELMHLFTAGNHQRKVGGTKMNAESSRSHSVFSVLLEVYNKASKKTTTGKLSLVDLAGSERADKTGATADRLKEAQSINKSLSALGDVISALSRNEKFIPYRNNKLTQVMQDSLGGNAKTLMFVNISPADYNQDETVTALTYATRVKLITNTAEKQQDGEEVSRLKETIRRLRAGEHHNDRASGGNGDREEDGGKEGS